MHLKKIAQIELPFQIEALCARAPFFQYFQVFFSQETVYGLFVF